MNLRGAVELFLEDRNIRGCSENALRAYRQHCSLFVDWLDSVGVSAVSELHSRWIEKYLDSLRNRNQLRRDGHLSPVTVHKRMKHLRTFFLWLVRKGHIGKDVDLSFPMPKTRKRLPKALAPDEVKLLLSVETSERDKAILYLMLDSGLRISEVVGLVLDDLDLTRGMVHVRHGKGDKERYSLFGPITAGCLRLWLELRKSAEHYVFVDRWGNHLTVSGVYKIIRRIAKSAGIKVHPHALRHTFATEFLNSGGLAPDLQQLMGHEHIETTMIYAQVALDPLRERYSKLSIINRYSGDKKTEETTG